MEAGRGLLRRQHGHYDEAGRQRAGAVEEWFSLLPLYRQALLLACVLALAALVVYFRDLTQDPTDDVVIINSPVSLTYLP